MPEQTASQRELYNSAEVFGDEHDSGAELRENPFEDQRRPKEINLQQMYSGLLNSHPDRTPMIQEEYKNQLFTQ